MDQLQDTESLFNNRLPICLQCFFLSECFGYWISTQSSDWQHAKYIFMPLQGKLQLPLLHGTSFYFQVLPWSILFQTICQLFITRGERKDPKQNKNPTALIHSTFLKATTICEQKILALLIIYSSSTLFKMIHFQQRPQQQKNPTSTSGMSHNMREPPWKM